MEFERKKIEKNKSMRYQSIPFRQFLQKIRAGWENPILPLATEFLKHKLQHFQEGVLGKNVC
jgi:hypothetical protein